MIPPSDTLLPDVHFLEQLWTEQVYYCKIVRKSPVLLSYSQGPGARCGANRVKASAR